MKEKPSLISLYPRDVGFSRLAPVCAVPAGVLEELFAPSGVQEQVGGVQDKDKFPKHQLYAGIFRAGKGTIMVTPYYRIAVLCATFCPLRHFPHKWQICGAYNDHSSEELSNKTSLRFSRASLLRLRSIGARPGDSHR